MYNMYVYCSCLKQVYLLPIIPVVPDGPEFPEVLLEESEKDEEKASHSFC